MKPLLLLLNNIMLTSNQQSHMCLLKIPVVAVITNFTHLGRLHTMFWNVAVGICALAATRALMGSSINARDPGI